MHGHVDPEEFLQGISGFLGVYFLLLAVMNAVAAFYVWQKKLDRKLFCVPRLGTVTTSLVLIVVSFLFTLASGAAFSGSPLLLSQAAMDAMDGLMNPVVYTVGIGCVLLFMFLLRRFFSRPDVAWVMLNASLLLMGLSMTDPDFAAIVTKPDNVPIVAMIYLLGFFTWLATWKAVKNDDRMARGEEPLEKLDDEKVLVWPDLVYTELICMVVLTAILLFWAIGLKAPLEEPASAVKTPNPSKAPWYFLGLQEMLVYYDPWMAGVVLPSMVIVGLMAIPFLDFNKKGNGYYTISQRQFAYLNFQFGFLVLWVTLIVMGTFLRGPNWNFFGIYETWDAHKVEALNNVDLSERFWIQWLGRARPRPPADAGLLESLGTILLRESLGIVLVIMYFALLPPMMVVNSRFFRGLFVKMGFVRYMVLMNLLLTMGLLPLKMFARWSFNMKYFIAIPEYFLNF